MRWHYTIGAKLKAILTDGKIKPTTAFIPRGERPIVWFTSSSVWEETATKGILDPKTGEIVTATHEEPAAQGGGLFRFGVADDFPLHPFWRISRESQQNLKVTQALLDIAIQEGSNPERDWWGTFHEVHCADWKALEHFTPDGWQLFLNVEEVVQTARRSLGRETA
jgi:hypothetical protein